MAATPNALKMAYKTVTGNDVPDTDSTAYSNFKPWKDAWNALQLSHQSPAVGALVVSYAERFGNAFGQDMLNAVPGADEKFWRLSMWVGNLKGINYHDAFVWMKAYSDLDMAAPKSK